ncbi:hypothetical protein ACPESR_25505 [Nocardia testacea]|uniref:hypothetical protein n=1 Tax=Nocardia testacea TaxID=248551 RepID=UPI003C2D0422
MDQTSVAVGESVGQAIAEAELSLREVAALSGVPFTTLHRKVNGQGKTGFLLSELLSVAEVLNLRLSQLLPAEIEL